MGSRYVQAMHPAARSGYLYLLAAQWQSDDCLVSSDEEELAALSGLGALWPDFSRAILRNFVIIDDAKIRNTVLFEEWSEALRVFEARRKGAKVTNERSADAERAQSDTVTAKPAKRRAHTQTQTRTVTETVEQKPSGSPEEDSLHVRCRTLVHAFWHEFHPEDETAPWEASEAKQLKSLLAANPGLNEEWFKKLLTYRARSDVNRSQRPREWLATLTDFKRGPLDKFKQPKGEHGASTGSSSSNGTRGAAVGRVERSQSAFRQAALASIEAAGGFPAGPDDSGVSEPGASPGHSADVPARSGDAGGGVRDQSRPAGSGVVSHAPEILPPSQRDPGGIGSHGSQRAH